jgi:hypothetical protein
MTLILDNNSLQRLDNIHTYQCIEKVRPQFQTITLFSLQSVFSSS